MANGRIDENGLPVYAPGDFDYVRVVDRSTGASRNALVPEVTAASRELTERLDQVVADAEADIAPVVAGLGYLPPVPYASGLAVDSTRFTVIRDGQVYAPAAPVPFTTGAWDAGQWRLIQGVTGADLSSEFGAGMVGFPGGRTLADLGTWRGSEMLGWKLNAPDTYERPLAERQAEEVSVFDFIPPALHAEIRDYTSTADVTQYIQNAINWCMYLGRSSQLRMPSGRYNTTDTLHFGYGAAYTGGNAFRSITVVGESSGYRGEANFRQTVILPNFSDRPCIAVQGGRRVRVKQLALLGVNYDHVRENGLGGQTPAFDDVEAEAWLDPALHPNAASRYAPYAGVAIDPYAGSAPSPAYPPVAYPAFMGTQGQYGKSFSSDVRFEDCYIAGFVCGAVVQPSNADGNGDFVSFPGANIDCCVYGVSVGNSQSRQVNLDGTYFTNCHTALTNRKHGKQTGKFGGAITGAAFDRVINIVDIVQGYAGPMAFVGCYGELIWRIGGFGTIAGQNTSPTFDSCEFRLVDHPVSRGVPAVLYGGGQAIFRGGRLQVPSLPCMGEDVHLDMTFIASRDVVEAPENSPRALAQHALAGALPVGAGVRADRSTRIRYGRGGNQFIASDVFRPVGRSVPINRLAHQVAWSESAQGAGRADAPQQIIYSRSKAQVAVTFAGTTGEFNLGSFSPPQGVRPGDVIQDDQTGTIFLVSAVSGAVVTASALNNTKNTGFRAPISTSVGNWYFINCRMYATSYPNFGMLEQGSPVITGVGRGDGFAGFLSADIAVGDYIYQHDWLGRIFPLGATVVAIDTSSRTITMSGNATRTTAEPIPLHFWVRG